MAFVLVQHLDPNHESMLPELLQKVWVLRKLLFSMDEIEAMEFMLDKMKMTKNNAEFFDMMRKGNS